MNVIYNADCVDLMKTYSEDQFDMVFTSPPFKDEDVDGDYWEFYDRFFLEAMRISSKVVCIIHSATKMNELIRRYPPKRTIIWGKGPVKYSWRYNPILVYQKSDNYKVNKYIWSDAIGISPLVGADKNHVYQDPSKLYETVISMFHGCNAILDPFIGSGTTAIACINLGRVFVGIEKDTTVFEKTQERIGAALKQSKLV